MRLRLLFVSASILAFLGGVVPQSAVCRAQTDAPPPIPASLLVPDRYERAVKHQSSAPYYLIVTVVNDTTGEQKTVCLEGPQLFDAVRLENNLGYGRADWNKIRQFLLTNTARMFHFTNADAWNRVQPRYSPQTLAAVEAEFHALSMAELAERFDYARTHGIIEADPTDPNHKVYDYCAAAAYVLSKRGLLMGRADAGNTLYIITPQWLAEEDRRAREREEQTRRTKAEGSAFAAQLPGYTALIRRFRVQDPSVGHSWPGYDFSASVTPLSRQLIDTFDYANPVNVKNTESAVRLEPVSFPGDTC